MKKSVRNLVIVTSTLFATILIHRKYEEYQLRKSIKKVKATLEKGKLKQPEKSYITLNYIFNNSVMNSKDMSSIKEVKEVEVDDGIFDDQDAKKKYYTLSLRKAN